MELNNVDLVNVQMLPVDTEHDNSSSGGVNEATKMEASEKSTSDEPVAHIPLCRWVMHGAIKFGLEFCCAIEAALVTPILLQIGLPEQYNSLTWFLSPILGLIFTPLIGLASERCTLKWGRRRPFILALCIGLLLGLVLFLNGSLMGLTAGDVPGEQPYGIILIVVGVVVLDFSADALDGPIDAYLLDVAQCEEQAMALNSHAVSAGLGAAFGYIAAGLDWTNTFLGIAFKAQEQVLFFFAAIIFIISVLLHMFSIQERPYKRCQKRKSESEEEVSSSSSQLHKILTRTRVSELDHVTEDDYFETHEEYQSETEVQEDFLNLKRNKSDPVLSVPDTTLFTKLSLSLNDLDRIARRRKRRTLQKRGRISSGIDKDDDGEREEEEVCLSIFKMPPQLWRLCICHFLTMFSVIVQANFYTDFMGQVIYSGDPMAAASCIELQNYHKGVQMGCWGLFICAATSAICSDSDVSELPDFWPTTPFSPSYTIHVY